MPVKIALALAILLPASAASAAELTRQDFATKAAQSDMFEIEAANLVLEKGTSEEVKAFAGNMVKDHGRGTHELHEAASRDAVSLPTDMGADLARKLESLSH